MYALAGQLARQPDVRLSVAAVHGGGERKVLDLDGVRYHLLPGDGASGYPRHLEAIWKAVCAEAAPDLVHIHGTEYLHGLACMRACPSLRYVVSIQGLVGVYARYYYAGISGLELLRSTTPRDLVRWRTVFHGKRHFEEQGRYEREYLRRTRHVIGRTLWDRTHARAIHPGVTYHHCDEILRDGFYPAAPWNPETKVNHRIFLSQGGYPIKGLHQALRAVALLKRDFPNVEVRVAGANILGAGRWYDRWRIGGYGSYVAGLIRELGVRDHVTFTGRLLEEEMIAEYRSAHVFVCPSSIENSPNSVGEAQLLGVPTIASYVGGVPDMVADGETGLLYRFEEVERLAELVGEVFSDAHLAYRLSTRGRDAAVRRHDPATNREQSLRIYREIAA